MIISTGWQAPGAISSGVMTVLPLKGLDDVISSSPVSRISSLVGR